MQDSQKRKLPATKDNFFPVPLGRNRKEIAQSWFQDLAGNKPLSILAKKVHVHLSSMYIQMKTVCGWNVCVMFVCYIVYVGSSL